MQSLSFSKFTHMRSEAIANLIAQFGKLEVTIRGRNAPDCSYAVVPKERLEQLEALEREHKRRQKAQKWEEENRAAILEQRSRVEQQGLFSDKLRRF